jgi:hypothetical protein
MDVGANDGFRSWSGEAHTFWTIACPACAFLVDEHHAAAEGAAIKVRIYAPAHYGSNGGPDIALVRLPVAYPDPKIDEVRVLLGRVIAGVDRVERDTSAAFRNEPPRYGRDARERFDAVQVPHYAFVLLHHWQHVIQERDEQWRHRADEGNALL